MNKTGKATDRLIVALDVDTAEKALRVADMLKKEVSLYKVGFELFSSAGPDIVRALNAAGCRIFLDLKFHDIPNTVARASAAVTRPGVFMFNVHASGGGEMMSQASAAARAAASGIGIDAPKIIAVTVLTSMDRTALADIGIGGEVDAQVLRLARLARRSGLDGVVASPAEAAALRRELGPDAVIVTPGVRPADAKKDDQKRIATPAAAVRAGASFIVVGRPILDAADPREAARKIREEIEG